MISESSDPNSRYLAEGKSLGSCFVDIYYLLSTIQGPGSATGSLGENISETLIEAISAIYRAGKDVEIGNILPNGKPVLGDICMDIEGLVSQIRAVSWILGGIWNMGPMYQSLFSESLPLHRSRFTIETQSLPLIIPAMLSTALQTPTLISRFGENRLDNHRLQAQVPTHQRRSSLPLIRGTYSLSKNYP